MFVYATLGLFATLISGLIIGGFIGLTVERQKRAFSIEDQSFFSSLGRVEQAVFICTLIILSGSLLCSLIFFTAYEHKIALQRALSGQPLDAQTMETGQEYEVVPAPDGVEWIKAKGSNEPTAYKFKSSPPKLFIPTEVDENGRKVFLSTNTNQDLLRNQKIHSGTK